jgi:hypothetical protein
VPIKTSLLLALVTLLTSSAWAFPPRPAASADAGTQILGPTADVDWGRPLASGDFDDDGFDDLVVVASESFGGITSQVFVIRGGPGGHNRGVIDLAVTPADLTISGAAVDDNLGSSAASGDVNGDGIDDLLLCASTADPGGLANAGIAYLLFGEPTFFATPTRSMAFNTDWDVRFLGPVAGGDMGGALLFGGLDAQACAIGNLNGDAFGDVVLGVHLADGNRGEAGRVYVRMGNAFNPGLTFNLSSAGSSNFQVWGAGELDELGTVVLTGDLTGDGIDELILPNQYRSKGIYTSEGATHIYRGRASWPTGVYNLATTPANITLIGGRASDEFGSSAAAGDFNGDGVGDVVISAPGAELGPLDTQQGDGIVYGFLGRPQYQTGTYSIDLASSSLDFTLIGEFQEGLGNLVAAGDFNGDGVADIAAAEWFSGPSINGSVDVLLGRDFEAGASYRAAIDTDLRILGAASDRIGFSLAVSNTNGDALDEVFFGTPFNNASAGTAYVHTHVSGDADFDRDVDLRDFAALQPCIGNPIAGPPTLPCVLIDFTLDEQVDGADVDGFTDVLSGPGA